ncbi:MAG: hypothetical protein ACYTG5_18155, partial [Planctomycetota bacterium]
MHNSESKHWGVGGVLVLFLAIFASPSIAQKEPAMRLDTDLAGSARSSLPRMAASGDKVYVVWRDERNGIRDIYFNRSLDGGASWLESDIRLDSDDPQPGVSRVAEIAASGDAVYVAWRDDRNGASDIYFNRSLDAGSTWLESDVRIGSDAPGVADSGWPAIAADGQSVYLVWGDGRNSEFGVYFNCSHDGGLTWLPADLRLNAAPDIVS